MNNTEKDALTNMVLDRMHEDFALLSKEERARMVDAAIEATNAEFGIERERVQIKENLFMTRPSDPIFDATNPHAMANDVIPQRQPSLVDYVWRVLTDDRHELTYRLKLAWSGIKHELVG